MNITKKLSEKTASNLPKDAGVAHKNNKKATIKLKHNKNVPTNNKVNLFNKFQFFNNY